MRAKVKNDVSIEYAHIYTNEQVHEEHELSLKKLDTLRKEFKEAGLSKVFVIMIDDYSFPDPTFDYDDFASWLSARGHMPDLMIRESQLIPLCDELLGYVQDVSLKKQLVRYITAKGKYPCSLFVAAWYLLRLGYLSHDSFRDDLYAERVINILPESFKPFEEKALDILVSSDYPETASMIENHYVQGRLIA